MPEPKITKTISIDRNLASAIEGIARKERRSFTKTVEIMLEAALERKETRQRRAAQALYAWRIAVFDARGYFGISPSILLKNLFVNSLWRGMAIFLPLGAWTYISCREPCLRNSMPFSFSFLKNSVLFIRRIQARRVYRLQAPRFVSTCKYLLNFLQGLSGQLLA